MLHEFAIDPGCMPTLDALKRITDQCAFHLGRFVSDFPKNRWVLLVRQKVTAQGFIAQQQLANVLINLKLRGGLLDTGRPYDQRQVWLDNALGQHAIRPFQGIVTSLNVDSNDFILIAADLSPETERWNVQPEDRIARTANDLCSCVKALFRHSSEILFVDPHFTPDTSRYQHALQEFLKAAHEDGRTYTRIEYHAKILAKRDADPVVRQAWVDAFRAACVTNIGRRVPRGVTLQIKLWEELAGGDEMHARYVMTERGAIRIDKGLDLGEPGQTTDVGLVSPMLYLRRWNDVQPGARTYAFVESIDIVGTRRL